MRRLVIAILQHHGRELTDCVHRLQPDIEVDRGLQVLVAQHTADELVIGRVVLQDEPVLEGSDLTLVGVADEEFLVPPGLSGQLPLVPSSNLDRI